MNEKMMQMIEMMLTKHKAMKHGGKPGEYGKEAEDMEEGYEEEGYGEEGEDETEVTIKFCGKDALKKAHDLLMSSYKK
jgi:hypothetical protein